MDVAVVVWFVGVLVFVAHFFAWLFSFTRIPDVLLLLIIGIVLGPWLNLLTPEFFGEAGTLFAVIVLVVLLFKSGTELRLDIIQQSWRGALLLVVITFILTMVVAGGLVWLLSDIPFLLALALGAIIGSTSPEVVVPLLEQLPLSAQSKATLTLESTASDVLVVVVTLALLTAFTIGEVDVDGVTVSVLQGLVGAALLGVGGGFVWSLLLGQVRRMRNSIFTTPALVFILYGLAEFFGWNGLVATLVFGVVMGNVVFFKLWLERKHVLLHSLLHPLSLSERERAFFSEVMFILQTFFFVFVGLSIPLENGWAFVLAALLVAVIFLVRMPVVRFSMPVDISRAEQAVVVAIAPRGLAAAVLATLMVQQGVLYGIFIQDVVYAVILISILVTSMLVFVTARGLRPVASDTQEQVKGLP